MFNCQLKIKNKNQTKTLAKQLARILSSNDCVCLIGDLGLGKTFFSQSLIGYFCSNKPKVTSPTFTLVNIYDCNQQQIWHLDLYRIKHEEEALELGIEDALGKYLTIIEWADRLNYLYPKNALTLSFTFNQEDNSREVTLSTEKPNLIIQLNQIFNNEAI
ncbi:tRNA (adenosine(37)-N6)-threonylcarbamoyltransferase complex ATPase subunit type 1 TsaE [Rickettsiales bacterium LUAb2]